MRFLILPISIIFFIVNQSPGQSQEDEVQVIDVAKKFFHALEMRDSVGFRTVFHRDAYNYFVQQKQDSVASGGRSSFKFNFKSKRVIEEKMRSGEVKVQVHGRIAMIWAPYDLWIDKKFSHCGVDVFTLLKLQGGWKIATIAYTIEPEGCTPGK
jgi:hypothetical protein